MYLIQVLRSLQLLHGKGICHRDLKAANTFLGEDGSVKIGDMNVSKQLKYGPLNTQIGTPYYMSPEIWSNRPYDEKCDIWSVGCMIYELASLRPPFLGDSFPALKRCVLSGRYPSLPRVYSEALTRVIASMLQLQAKDRLTAAQMLSLPDIAARMNLLGPDCDNAAPHSEPHGHGPSSVLRTIKVPQVLAKLNDMLPRPCYPSVAPPAAAAGAAKPPLPPIPGEMPAADKENAPPASNYSYAPPPALPSSNYSYAPVPPPAAKPVIVTHSGHPLVPQPPPGSKAQAQCAAQMPVPVPPGGPPAGAGPTSRPPPHRIMHQHRYR